MTSLSSIILANEQELERNFLLFNSISSQGERISYWKPKWSGNVLTEKYIGKSIVRSENFTRIQENYELENYFLRNFHRAASYLVSCTQNCSIKKESFFLVKKRKRWQPRSKTTPSLLYIHGNYLALNKKHFWLIQKFDKFSIYFFRCSKLR